MKLLPIALLLLVSSCYTPRKAERQVIKAKAHYPEMIAGACADWYPSLDSTGTSTEIKPGVELPPVINQVQVNCDSMLKAGIANATIPCPPCKQKAPDTVEKKSHTTIVNRARETELELALARKDKEMQDMKDYYTKQGNDKDKQIAVLQDDNSELKKAKNRFMWCLIGVAVVYIARLILQIKFPAMGWFIKWVI